MRTFKIYTLALLTIASVTACKKGANDPALSLKSRKGRLAGEWKLSSGEQTNTTTFSGTTNVTTTSYDGSNRTITGSGTTNTTPYTQELTFEKDGTYKNKVTDDGSILTEEGYWQFMGKSKEGDIKKKEAITMTYTKYTDDSGVTTVEGKGVWGSTVRFDKLSSKEIIVLIDTQTSQTDYSSTTTGTMTYVPK